MRDVTFGARRPPEALRPATALRKPRVWPTIAGLCIAFGAPSLLVRLLGGKRPPAEATFNAAGTILWDWGSVLLLLVLILTWERLPIRSVGLRRPGWGDLTWGVVGFVVGLLAWGAAQPLAAALGGAADAAEGVSRLAQLPLSTRIALVLTAGITEEILFRGYPIERISAWTGSTAAGAVLSYAVFVGAHLPLWGVGGMVQVGAWSLVVTALYVWRRSLVACMLMHVLNDAFAFLLLPVLVPELGAR